MAGGSLKVGRSAARALRLAELGIGAAALLALAACGGSRSATSEAGAGAAASSSPSDYAPPPRITAVASGTSGSALVSGEAAPDSRVRAVTTDQATYGATTGHDGRFVLELPSAERSRLVALSADTPRRSSRATGWLFIPPDAPEQAVLLRAGAPAGPLAGAGLIAAVDYDASGGVAVSGRVQPNASVSLSVDSGAAQDLRANAGGDWSARLANTLPAGPHVLHVRSGSDHADCAFVLQARPIQGVFQATRERGDWRVDWTPPGGGAQTTLVLVGSARS
jgi:hypothetical protein